MSETEVLNEGKTKRVLRVPGKPDQAYLDSKDDITAGDGKKHDVMPGKGALSTRTTANIFRLLKESGIPLAFISEESETRLRVQRCEMIAYEVVVRREAHGSYIKRNPHIKAGHVFPQLICEFFLKTSGKKWNGVDIPADDPLIVWREDGGADIYLPDQPVWTQKPFMTLAPDEVPRHERREDIAEMERIAKKVFLILEKAWQLVRGRYVDYKVEFGITSSGELVLADVIDSDSGRVIKNGGYFDKQLYRDGAPLSVVETKYRQAADLTDRFENPRQKIIIWRGSESDKVEPFQEAIKAYGAEGAIEVEVITCSLHKKPVQACLRLAKATQEIPDAVIIAYVGMSNGAGPTLSAQTSAPVITVPATGKEFPEDTWSSLRTPSETPVATILNPKNAVLAALQMLAARNPRLYAELRTRQEERLVNVFQI